MSETQPELPEQPQRRPDPEPAPESAAEPDMERAGDPIGHALYDLTLRRFVGGVYPSKAKANRKDAKVAGHSYEVRLV